MGREDLPDGFSQIPESLGILRCGKNFQGLTQAPERCFCVAKALLSQGFEKQHFSQAAAA
jgi:hypothetical protein